MTVATTRPETMLGDTGVAIHPENEKLKHLIGKRARLPLVGRLIPIVGDEYADPEKGTGAVKITPAHDFNDFEVGKRHKLAMINIFDAEARLALQGNSAFLEGVAASAELEETLRLHGDDRFLARTRVVARMASAGLLAKVEPHAHMVPHGDRSNVAIEPWLTDQWYVDAKTLAQPALKAVREGKTTFVPKAYEKTYFDWLENIQPWCVSRQLWWGHQIPAWYDDAKTVYVAESEDEARAAARAKHGHEVGLTRDEDVLDTWFSSALWPFSTLGWPDATPELTRFYPTTTLVTGFDIIFFWVARMMMMGLHFMPEVPFHDVYIHALVRDEKGAKMSKSKGNVIDPLTLVDKYGADALRFTLAAMAAQGRDVKLSEQRVEGYRNFATKLWNAARFAELNGCVRVEGYNPAAVSLPLNRWILSETKKSVAETAMAIEAYRFNDAANAAYRFVWSLFCDWHLELAKPVLQGGAGEGEKRETQATIAFVLDAIFALLHPFMPFLTEELWRLTGENGPKRSSLLTLAPWPTAAAEGDAEAGSEIGWLVDLISEIRSARSEVGVPAAAQTPLIFVAAIPAAKERAMRAEEALKRLARVETVAFADAAPPGALQIAVHGDLIALPVAGLIDVASERARLQKELAKALAEIAKVDAKFANADFMARAPEDVVEENKERREAFSAHAEKMEAASKRLEAI